MHIERHLVTLFCDYSARLALPAPEEKRLATSEDPNVVEFCHQTYINSGAVGELEWSANYPKHAVCGNLQPFIEEPLSPEPEPENVEAKDGAIEDFFNEDPDEIPTINLNIEEFTQNLKNYMQANHVEIEYADMSKALVAITPEAASIPTPKLKNVSRLRTEHQVYAIGLDKIYVIHNNLSSLIPSLLVLSVSLIRFTPVLVTCLLMCLQL